ncbi:MAG: alpha-galactosidase [Planctomycetes bacterium]|nr:alpha-galactosidase [Planctomycetota bacterium]
MKNRIALAAVFTIFALVAPGTPSFAGLELENDYWKIEVFDDGTYSLSTPAGEPIVYKASVSVATSEGRLDTREGYYPAGDHCEVSDSTLIAWFVRANQPSIELRFILPGVEGENVSALFMYAKVIGDMGATERIVSNIDIIRARGADGAAVYPGAKARNAGSVQILENGHGMYFDYYCRIQQDGASSDSNWNGFVYDRESGTTFACGFLTTDRALTRVQTQSGSGALTLNHRTPFSSFNATCTYRPSIPTDGILTSETLYLDYAAETPFVAMENFARAVAKMNEYQGWQHDIPSGWNSWGGGGGMGGMGTNISEEIILENLEAAREVHRPYGWNYFQIDDGWEIMEGDWEANERFPHGMKWLADKINEAGFIPGIWVNGFMLDKQSQTYRDHPDWIAERNLIGRQLIPQNWEPLDLSHPEVKEHVRALFTKIVDDWGYGWIKLDFAYWTLFTQNHYDSSKTASEIYRDGLEIVRDVLGPDRFFLTVASVGASFGIADSVRISLDNEPSWDGLKPGTEGSDGIKPTLRTLSRRYYFQGNTWINHNDLLFYREPMTESESRCWTSVVGLTGGIAKLGERITDMRDHPDWAYQMNRILPVYGNSARPLDLFDREYPEKWDQHAQKNFTDAESGDWHNVGIFNWGLNNDLANRGENIAEEARTYRILPGKCGLPENFEKGDYLAWAYWWETPLEVSQENGIEVPLRPRDCEIVSIRKNLHRPQFVGWNRHITQGAAAMEDIDYEDGKVILNFTEVPERMRLYFHAPDGYVVAETRGVDMYRIRQMDGFHRIQINGTAFRKARMEVIFKRM